MIEKAIFAGGCFWCMLPPFRKELGILTVTAGYTGGTETNPTYEDVVRGKTGHREAVEVAYESDKMTYENLVQIFLQSIDPTDPEGQFFDQSPSYRTGIFYKTPEEKEIAERKIRELDQSGRFDKPVAVEILQAGPFYPAEDYHQTYPEDYPDQFESYERNSGRKDFIKKHWNPEKDKEALREKLSPEAYYVTQENGTEAPFTGEYNDEEREGIYVDIVSGEPLFSSKDKFHSGCGWPSFSQPIEPAVVSEKDDKTFGMIRTEVRSNLADSHLGHVFEDGPKEMTGLRYCINSAALRFIPKDKLLEEGYGSYLKLFEE